MLTYEYISSEHLDQIEQFQFNNNPDERIVGDFLREQALQLHQKKIAITRLYFDENQNLVGFFTVHNDFVKVTPYDVRAQYWDLPDDLSYFPAVKLHFLGVDRRYRHLGYGKHLVREATFIADEISEQSGCNFISVEALLTTVHFYVKRGFRELERKPEFAYMVFKLGEINEEDSTFSFEPPEAQRLRIKEKLIRMREEMGIDHTYLAQLAGIDEFEVEIFEFSTEVPRWETIEIIAYGLGVEVETLWED